MEHRLRTFEELTAGELYQLLQLRSEVFVVEQQCIYLDADGKDYKALHLLGYEGERLTAYTRLFAPGDYCEEASIGAGPRNNESLPGGRGKALRTRRHLFVGPGLSVPVL